MVMTMVSSESENPARQRCVFTAVFSFPREERGIESGEGVPEQLFERGDGLPRAAESQALDCAEADVHPGREQRLQEETLCLGGLQFSDRERRVGGQCVSRVDALLQCRQRAGIGQPAQGADSAEADARSLVIQCADERLDGLGVAVVAESAGGGLADVRSRVLELVEQDRQGSWRARLAQRRDRLALRPDLAATGPCDEPIDLTWGGRPLFRAASAP